MRNCESEIDREIQSAFRLSGNDAARELVSL